MKQTYTYKKTNKPDLKWLLQSNHSYRLLLLQTLNDESQLSIVERTFTILAKIDQDLFIEQIARIYHKVYLIKNQMTILSFLESKLALKKEEIVKKFDLYNEYTTLYKKQAKQSIDEMSFEDMTGFILQHYPRLYFKDLLDHQKPYVTSILEAYHHNDQTFLKEEAAILLKKEDHLIQQQEHKLKQRILQKAKRQLRTYLKLKDQELKNKLLAQLKETTQEKLSGYCDEEVTRLYEIIDQAMLSSPSLLLPAVQYFHYTKKEAEDNADLEIILSFYNQHHLYIKLKKIRNELIQFPSIPAFFKQYYLAYQNSKISETINQLDILIEDIHIHSELKKLESIGKLLSISKKEVEAIIREADNKIEPLKDENISTNQEFPENCITIGGFTLNADTVRANPDTLETLIPLISFDRLHQVDQLQKLMYEVGYDKLKTYIQKQPQLEFRNLLTIVRIDRLLRYQYQALLESVELYFRSGFTQYLSNKYDEIYEVIGKDTRHFYYRGYLRNYVFEDNILHYENIKKLNTRIDNEMIANNQQVIDEYRECKYAISFSTAAGLMTFGWLIGIFQNLIVAEKKALLEEYYVDLTPQTFNAWIVGLNNLRNKCAHYQSLYRLSSMKELRPIMTKPEDQCEMDKTINHHSLFYYTLLAVRLSPNEENVIEFIDSAERLFEKAHQENSSFDLELDYSFPVNWKEILLNEKSSHINKKRNQ
ncbi:MAG: Abi family protein [Beduini sp.]|uniref:Abi family protein n=1 Tax=Beduini sp. TaxID=1922300 RepID=UPI0011CA8702